MDKGNILWAGIIFYFSHLSPGMTQLVEINLTHPVDFMKESCHVDVSMLFYTDIPGQLLINFEDSNNDHLLHFSIKKDKDLVIRNALIGGSFTGGEKSGGWPVDGALGGRNVSFAFSFLPYHVLIAVDGTFFATFYAKLGTSFTDLTHMTVKDSPDFTVAAVSMMERSRWHSTGSRQMPDTTQASNQSYPAQGFDSVLARSSVQCAIQCHRRRGAEDDSFCLAFNYHRENKACELLGPLALPFTPDPTASDGWKGYTGEMAHFWP